MHSEKNPSIFLNFEFYASPGASLTIFRMILPTV